MLNSLLPYLIIKKAQAKILIEFQANRSSYVRKSLGQGLGSKPLSAKEIKYKTKLHNQVRLLNTKGVYSRINLKPKTENI